MGLTVLDAGVLIGLLDDQDAHHQASFAALTDARERGDELVLPASALAECLVRPWKAGPDAVAIVQGLLRELPIRVAALDEETAVRAARLRARHNRLRLPDALVVATAAMSDAAVLVTTDAGWPDFGKSELEAAVVVVKGVSP